MKFFITLKKKKLVTTKSTGDAPDLWLPLPTPPPANPRSCKKPEGYILPALALPPLHAISRLQQPSPPSELRASRSQLHDVPLSPKMLKVLGADGNEEEKISTYLKSQKKSMWTWPCLPTDAESLSDQSINKSYNHSPTSVSNKRGTSPNGLVTQFENPGAAGGFQPQECSPAEYWSTTQVYDENEWHASSPFQFSPSTASPADVSMCSTPLRSPRKQGKSFGPLHELSSPRPCRLPSPPRSPWRTQTISNQLDNRSQSCPSKPAPVLQDLPTRPRSLPTRDQTSTRPHQMTPPTSPRPLKMNPDLNFENIQDVPNLLYSSPPGNASPLHRMNLQAVPKPPQRWKRGAMIGSGSFGCVYEGWNFFFAVKVSDSDNIAPEIHQEVAMLSRLRHPNIVQYYGTTTENGTICIFLELLKMGSLQAIMKKFQVFDEVLISSYTRQILKGLEYQHAKNTVHRDIKCANILVDSDGQVKLADFGLAKQMKESLATSVKGSPLYMAPEILLPGQNKRPYGLAVDIWSLGCTVLEMADGKTPWSGLQGYGFFFKVMNGELPPIPEHLSDQAKDFITQCLRKHPEDRPTEKDLLVHPFVGYAPTSFRASVAVRD